MKIPPPLVPRARMAVVSAVASLLWALPAASQAPVTTAAEAIDKAFDNLLLRLMVIVLCGALGAFVADLVADQGRLERWKKDSDGWTLGFLGKLIVGSVAAVIVLSLKPPSDWWLLIGTALSAGVGSEAILLSIIASYKAEKAEKDREHAEANARGITALAQERLATLKEVALAEADCGRTVSLLAGRFGVELATFAAAVSGGTIRQRVRAILVRRLGHEDVDSRPLGEIGGGDAEVRRLIARDIRTEFLNLNPPWTEADVTAASTLSSLVDEIDRRMPLAAMSEERGDSDAPVGRAFAAAAEPAVTRVEGGSIRQRVRAILVRQLGHEDVDSRPLGEIGGADAGVRRLIARDIRMEFPDLNPPWTEADVTASSTLSSLVDEIDRRSPLP